MCVVASMLNKQVNEERNGRKIKRMAKKNEAATAATAAAPTIKTALWSQRRRKEKNGVERRQESEEWQLWRRRRRRPQRQRMRFLRACNAHCIWINAYIQCATWALIPFKDNFNIISPLSSWPFILQHAPLNLFLTKRQHYQTRATDAETTTSTILQNRALNKKNSHKVNIRNRPRVRNILAHRTVFFFLCLFVCGVVVVVAVILMCQNEQQKRTLASSIQNAWTV